MTIDDLRALVTRDGSRRTRNRQDDGRRISPRARA